MDEKKLEDAPKPSNEPSALDDVEQETGDQIKKELDAGKTVDDILPESINLNIPFYAQAPEGDWSLPWKEACEEASITLAAYYMKDQPLSLEQFKEDILNLVALEEEMFGKYIDTNVQETAEVYEAYYGIGTTRILEDPTIEDLKTELAQGHPIVAPFAGRELGNSYFTDGGPRYHMLVIK